MVEVVDLFENFVHRSDDAGLGPCEAVTVIFQPGGERSEGTVTVTTHDLLRGDLRPGQAGGDDHQEKQGDRHAGCCG